jgi:hypothetical protein
MPAGRSIDRVNQFDHFCTKIGDRCFSGFDLLPQVGKKPLLRRMLVV